MEKLLKTKGILTWVALILPPWNIFWWLVGTLLHLTGVNKRFGAGSDPTDRIILFVFFAPATLPLMPYLIVKDKLTKRSNIQLPKLSKSPPADQNR